MASFIDLPLQVRDGCIYFQKLSAPSGAPNQAVIEEVLVWHRESFFFLDEGSTWKALAHELLDLGEGSSKKIKESELVRLVKNLGGDEMCARHVSLISNAKRPKLRTPKLSPEMAYQQLIFPPITCLFYSFDPDLYAADSMACTGFFTYKDQEGSPVRLMAIKPDAAVKISKKHLVLAMLELKKKGPHKGDMQKCVLMSSISALALLREGGLSNVTIPIVVNDCELAHLYSISVDTDNECPEIKLILSANMSDENETAEMVAYLAVMIVKLMQGLKESSNGMRFRRRLDMVPGPSSTPRSNRSHPPSSGRSRSLSGLSEPSVKKPREDRAELGAAAAEVALVASCEGDVEALRRFHCRSRGSPFYFVGVLANARVPVFIKVWRGGDKRTNRRHVETEARLLKAAHQRGVPCPLVVDRWTVMDVDGERDKYHRLVMHKLPDDAVDRQDVHPFAVSLIVAVRKLHNDAGILHCDIKPNNILWSSSTKAVSLVDFGHAQEERNAESYNGTVGFTAPEVTREGKPHSRLTDAYSVGMTLLYVCECVLTSSEHSPVREVAAQLSSEDALTRITLEDALRQVLPVEKQAQPLEVPQTPLEIVTP
jgi:Protein kinase domain